MCITNTSLHHCSDIIAVTHVLQTVMWRTLEVHFRGLYTKMVLVNRPDESVTNSLHLETIPLELDVWSSLVEKSTSLRKLKLDVWSSLEEKSTSLMKLLALPKGSSSSTWPSSLCCIQVCRKFQYSSKNRWSTLCEIEEKVNLRRWLWISVSKHKQNKHFINILKWA